MSALGENGARADEHERSRVALRESESRLATALEIAQLGVAEFDPAHEAFFGDERWSEIVGAPPGSPLPLHDFLARIHPDDRDELMKRMLRAPATGGFEASYRILHDGAIRHVEARGRAMADCAADQGLPCIRFVGTVMDVTERREAERQLREADRRKDEFLAMLGHELRNPLAPIANVVKLLEMTVEPQPRVQQLLDILARQTRTLRTLVDDLLDVARITRGLVVLKRDRVPLAAIIQAALESVQPLFDEKHHRFTVRQPPRPAQVMGDQVRLEQALVNVLTNSAKYMDPGGEVSIVVALRGAEVELTVRDRGIGIAPELCDHIFDLFGQAERGLDRSQGGLGIGLAITKGLVELHGGSIEAVSDGLGKGAQFAIRLPLAPGEGKTNEPPAEYPDPVLSSMRVLVVDDNVDAADTLVLLLGAFGHEVTVAHDGAAALAWVAANEPDVVLLDIGLPGMDGYEVARRLRTMPETGAAKIVALTGYGQSEEVSRARSAHFDAYFVKPLDVVELQALLSEL